eukprot:g6471.t1
MYDPSDVIKDADSMAFGVSDIVDFERSENVSVQIAKSQQLLLFCFEPWCSVWGYQPTRRRSKVVGPVIGYSRKFDFWWPIGCREWLWFADNGPLNYENETTVENWNVKSSTNVFISNCDAKWRVDFVRDLSKHIKLDSFGACYHTHDLKDIEMDRTLKEFSASNIDVNEDEFWLDYNSEKLRKLYEFRARKIVSTFRSNYPFQISVENTILSDYVTEKLVDALLAGSLPIYVGAARVRSLLGPDVPIIDVFQLYRSFIKKDESVSILQFVKNNDVSDEEKRNKVITVVASYINRLLSDSKYEELQKIHRRAHLMNHSSPLIQRCRELRDMGIVAPPPSPPNPLPLNGKKNFEIFFHIEEEEKFKELLCAACAAAQPKILDRKSKQVEFHYVGCFRFSNEMKSKKISTWNDCRVQAINKKKKMFALQLHEKNFEVSHCDINVSYDTGERISDHECAEHHDSEGHFLGSSNAIALYMRTTFFSKDEKNCEKDDNGSSTSTKSVTLTLRINDGKPTKHVVHIHEEASEVAKHLCWDIIDKKIASSLRLAECVERISREINLLRVKNARKVYNYLFKKDLG